MKYTVGRVRAFTICTWRCLCVCGERIEKKSPSYATTTTKMECVFLHVSSFPLYFFVVVCLVPYVRRKMSTLPRCLCPSSTCKHISWQQYLQNVWVFFFKNHLCLHISRVPLYRTCLSSHTLSSFFSSLRITVLLRAQTNTTTGVVNRRAQVQSTRIYVMYVIVYSVVIFILFASFAFCSINSKQLCSLMAGQNDGTNENKNCVFHCKSG